MSSGATYHNAIVEVDLSNLPTAERVRKAQCGSMHCVLLTFNGLVATWGKGKYLGMTPAALALAETRVPTVINPFFPRLSSIFAIDIAVGSNHTLVASSDGTMFGFGDSPYLQFAATVRTQVPTEISPLSGELVGHKIDTVSASRSAWSLSLESRGRCSSFLSSDPRSCNSRFGLGSCTGDNVCTCVGPYVTGSTCSVIDAKAASASNVDIFPLVTIPAQVTIAQNEVLELVPTISGGSRYFKTFGYSL